MIIPLWIKNYPFCFKSFKHYGKFFCMLTICLYNFCVYRLPAGTNLQYFCTSVDQILTKILVIQTLYFCKFAQNIWNWNSFLQFKCKRIANLSQNHFQTFRDEVQIYCTLVQSKCNWYFLPLIICKKLLFLHILNLQKCCNSQQKKNE